MTRSYFVTPDETGEYCTISAEVPSTLIPILLEHIAILGNENNWIQEGTMTPLAASLSFDTLFVDIQEACAEVLFDESGNALVDENGDYLF